MPTNAINPCSISSALTETGRAKEQRTKLLQFALEEAILDFCSVAFSPHRNTDLYDTLYVLGYDENDLLSSRSLSIHLYLFREQVNTTFLNAVNWQLRTSHFLAERPLTRCAKEGILLRALRRLQGKPTYTTLRESSMASSVSLNAYAKSDLNLCAVALESLDNFIPPMSSVNEATAVLFLLCLQRSLLTHRCTLRELSHDVHCGA